MSTKEPFSDSIYEEQAHIAEREISAFLSAITQLYRPEQAGLSEKDWLDESELMDSPPLSTTPDWRAVTIAAESSTGESVELCSHQAVTPVASTDTKVSSILIWSHPNRHGCGNRLRVGPLNDGPGATFSFSILCTADT